VQKTKETFFRGFGISNPPGFPNPFPKKLGDPKFGEKKEGPNHQGGLFLGPPKAFPNPGLP